MIRATFVLMLFGFCSFAQKTLVLEETQVAFVRTKYGELALDTLIMKDSSTLVFSRRQEMYLNVNHLKVGKGCILDGSGKSGMNGDNVPAFFVTRSAPNVQANSGWAGDPGTNLLLTVKSLDLADTLVILVKGGNGGIGAPAPASLAYASGDPGLGGQGGRGGDVIIGFPPEIEGSVRRIQVINSGGTVGSWGDFNPNNMIPLPFSRYDARARAYDFHYTRQIRNNGVAGTVHFIRLQPMQH